MEANAIPTLKSSRLVLRSLGDADLPDLLAMAHAPEVTRHLHEGAPPTAEEVLQRVVGALNQWRLRGYGMMAVEDGEGFVGRVGIYHPFDMPDAQLSYIFCRRGWGKGYATEAALVMRDWMFVTHNPSRLLSHIAPQNAASARVASKLGATRSGQTMQNGVELDVWTYPVPA